MIHYNEQVMYEKFKEILDNFLNGSSNSKNLFSTFLG